MKNILKIIGKNLFAGFVFVVGIVLTGLLFVFASSQLEPVNTGETLTAGTLNGIIDKVNLVLGRTDGISNVGGNIGIGTDNPSVKLDINGQIKINGGIPTNGAVLVSDTTGLGTWSSTNIPIKNSGSLPQSAGSTVVPANGSYIFGSINVTPGIYFYQIYNCNGQLSYTQGSGNTLYITGVTANVLHSTGTRTTLNNNVASGCGVFYSGIFRVESSGVIGLKIDSHDSSVLITPGPTGTAFNYNIYKIF